MSKSLRMHPIAFVLSLLAWVPCARRVQLLTQRLPRSPCVEDQWSLTANATRTSSSLDASARTLLALETAAAFNPSNLLAKPPADNHRLHPLVLRIGKRLSQGGPKMSPWGIPLIFPWRSLSKSIVSESTVQGGNESALSALVSTLKDSPKLEIGARTSGNFDNLLENRVSSSSSPLPLSLESLAKQLSREESGINRAQALVRLGDEWAQDQKPQQGLLELKRVPGCLAVVHIGVETSGGIVSAVHGTSDARVSRGLVAFLARGLKGLLVKDVLAINPEELCRAVGVYGLVSPSRINGFASMMRTIQEQLSAKNQVAHSRPLPSAFSHSKWSGLGGNEEVAVLLSGGVDSSVALRMAQEAGMKPRAFYLKIWLEDELSHLNQCPWEEDWEYASAVAAQAGVPLEVVSMQHEYWDTVVKETIQEARAGRTPNPDILCNARVKFGMFYDQVGKHFSQIITGHYARVAAVDDGEEGEVGLFRSPDPIKDQTYFLSSLSQEQLRSATFPIGEFEKSRVRDLAEELVLPTMKRKDSQGICFLGKLKWDDFLEHHLGESPGDVRELGTGAVVGRHRGLYFHTIGQRKGVCRVINDKETHRGPWYAAGKNVQENILYVTTKVDDLLGARSKFSVNRVSWISGRPPLGLSSATGRLELVVQVKHGTQRPKGMVEWSHTDADVLNIELHSPAAHSLAPGQYAAFYQGDRCLGSGVIMENHLFKEMSGAAQLSEPQSEGRVMTETIVM